MRKVYHAIQPYQPRRYKQFPPAKPGYKWCIDCEQEKLLTDFHQMQGTTDGRRPTCKECRKKRDLLPAIPVQLPLFILSKICTKCGKPKELDEFDVDQNGAYGRFSQCKQCRSDYNHQFWIDNLEESRARGRVKRAKPETKTQKKKRHQERSVTDPHYLELRRQRRQRYYQSHKEEAKDYYPRRRARLLGATIGKVDYRSILLRDGLWCYLCDKPIDPNARKRSRESLSFDHVIPIHPRPGEPQGTHSEDNLRPAHHACNVRKGNRPFETLTPFDRRGP